MVEKGALSGIVAAVSVIVVGLALEPLIRRTRYTPPSLRGPEKQAMLHRRYRVMVLVMAAVWFLIFLGVVASG